MVAKSICYLTQDEREMINDRSYGRGGVQLLGQQVASVIIITFDHISKFELFK